MGGRSGSAQSAGVAQAGGGSGSGVRSAVGTDRPFRVGALYSSNAQAALGALGAKGSIGDIKAEGDAVVAYVNGHGGVAGRRMVPEWYNGDATQSSTTIASEACTAWTQDDHVDAAVPGGSIVDMNTIRQCLAARNTPAASVEYHVQTRQQNFATSPMWIEPLGLSMESYAKTYAQSLAAQGFFTGKLGIVYDDGPDWTDVERSVLEPTLTRLGVHIAARASYQLRGFSDVAQSQPDVNNAVLRFKTAGVTRVITFEPWDGWAFFMQAADQQNFHPVYGLSSQAAFAATFATGIVPADQLTNAYFVGWSPVLDESTVSHGWPREQLCDSIYNNAGIHPSGPLATAIALSTCDGLLDMAQLGTAAGGNLGRTTFAHALAGVQWQSALMPSVKLSEQRRYGIVVVRDGRWNGTCQCFNFSGPNRSTSG